MGFQYVVPAVVGGTVLVIERIESQNYVTTVSGWAINADGTAEFFNVIARGSLIAGQIEINGAAYPNEIALFTGHPDEVVPGRIKPLIAGNYGYVRYSSPVTLLAATPATFDLEGYDDGHSAIAGDATNIRFTAGGSLSLEGSTVELTDFDGTLEVVSAVIRKQGEVWKGTGTTPLTGTWVDTAGSRFGYYKDATGRVQVRGRVSGGGAGATVVTLPAGYRPSSNLEFTMRAGTVVSAVSVSTAGVLTVTANLATASASGINLDCISFPTF